MFQLLFDPYIPVIWKVATATDAEITELLQRIRDNQSPGVQHIQRAIR